MLANTLAVVPSSGRFWEAKLYRLQGDLLLAALYGWFSKGVDTRDLQATRQLLAQVPAQIV